MDGLSSSRPGFGSWVHQYEVFGDIPGYAQMCLTSRVASNGAAVIPTSEVGGVWRGFAKDTPQALEYARSRSATFTLTPEVRLQADAKARTLHDDLWLATARRIALMIIIVGAGLELAWRVLWWIMRGFSEEKTD